MQPSAVGDVSGGEGGVAADQVCCHSPQLRTVIMVTRIVSSGFPTIVFLEAWEGVGEGDQN